MSDWRCRLCDALESDGGCEHDFEACYEEATGSAFGQETCPACGYVDTRDGFEGMERRDGANVFAVRCPSCEALHPDQSDHDDDPEERPIPVQVSTEEESS